MSQLDSLQSRVLKDSKNHHLAMYLVSKKTPLKQVADTTEIAAYIVAVTVIICLAILQAPLFAGTALVDVIDVILYLKK